MKDLFTYIKEFIYEMKDMMIYDSREFLDAIKHLFKSLTSFVFCLILIFSFIIYLPFSIIGELIDLIHEELKGEK